MRLRPRAPLAQAAIVEVGAEELRVLQPRPRSRWAGKAHASAGVAGTEGGGMNRTELIEKARARFCAKTQKGPKCWLWTGAALQLEVNAWTYEADALRSVVGATASLYESYRGGPFGVCQRTVRDVERSLFFFAQAAKSRFVEPHCAARSRPDGEGKP